ncbi:GNAT family N-acetyltransferase [Amycolatopsis vastitatis]|uniref:N-acetyltransferase domain-containing protein n=1 Tax=Amycolatopsis vastitatis TaxID=1905142 RepID=A0A229TF19_9PSEU|nr:GNAT family N-acetyltransferase [Amycolatopsis vastitatis]OXM69600.1 hypothetical protein CF165_08815 [Amycolatopsis vastitatis]
MTGEGGLARMIREMVVFSWPSQAAQYPQSGPPGISYFRGDVSESFGSGAYVDCLLMRDVDGVLVGILNHYPQDLPPHERAGAVSIRVRPDRQRRGIGTHLLKEAMTRWRVQIYRQRFTPSGAAFAEALLRREVVLPEDLQ